VRALPLKFKAMCTRLLSVTPWLLKEFHLEESLLSANENSIDSTKRLICPNIPHSKLWGEKRIVTRRF
jgi:hypothetical protein